MEGSFYSYGMMIIICTMIIANDLRKRVFGREDILYRVKDHRKKKHIYFVMGLTIPIVIMISGIVLEYQLATRILVLMLSLEMIALWALIELSDGLITKTHAGKVWYTRFSQIEYYTVMPMKGNHYIVFKKLFAKRQEMLMVNQEDLEAIQKILASLGLKTFAEVSNKQNKR